ncbi:CARDB domain-containing protein [Haloferax namakaokahaiae]|uniref:CARDB domain-containing protein n=1 Tax=Haloferax namakaokahaiae TaxID=1748331 RepID=A0ABD5ZDB7_9EURY
MVNSRHVATSLLVGVVLLSLASPLGVGLADAIPDARVAVTDATVTPATPTAGAPLTVDATVRLSAGSASAATLDTVEIRTTDGDVVGSATGLGSLSPGETLTVPVTFTLDSAGEYELTLVAVASDSNDEEVTATRPLTIAVEQGVPQLELNAPTLVVDTDSAIQATVSNPTTAPIRDLTVTVTNPSDGEQVRRTVPQLAAGASTTLNFSVLPASEGPTNVTTRIDYTTASGTVSNATYGEQIRVEPLANDVGVRIGPAQDASDSASGNAGIGGIAGLLNGGGGALQQSDSGAGDGAGESQVGVTVTNFGNAAIENVVLVPQTENGTVVGEIGRFAVADRLGPGESATVTVNLGNAETLQSLQFVAQYDLGGERRSVVTEFDRLARGAVELTDINISVSDGGAVRLGGNLANVGNGEITGVVVSVPESEHAQPAYPQRSYFVGTVASSEFAPFELTAQVDRENTSVVPVEVAYTVGDERTTETTMVELPAERQSSGNPLASSLTFAGAVVLVGIGVSLSIGFLVRQYR